MNRFLRTSLLLSDEKMKSLANSHIMVFGVGGVGGSGGSGGTTPPS